MILSGVSKQEPAGGSTPRRVKWEGRAKGFLQLSFFEMYTVSFGDILYVAPILKCTES